MVSNAQYLVTLFGASIAVGILSGLLCAKWWSAPILAVSIMGTIVLIGRLV